LNGLSKLLGLPQLKVAWIHVAGGPEDKEKAKRHLEWICDAYLSVGAAPQAACAGLLPRRTEFQGPIRERLERNRATLREFAAGHAALRPLWPQGGWCVPVRCAGIVEAGMDDEAFAIRLLEGVHVQPGYFFDFDEEAVIVLSLLPEPEVFREGLARIARHLG
jgi:aspartate/methionine/tyrosine aminotransferase